MNVFTLGFILAEACGVLLFKHLLNIGMHPYFIVLTTGILSSLGMGLIYWGKLSFRKNVKKLSSIKASLPSALAISIASLFGFISLKLTTVTNYTFIARLSVLLTPVLAWLILKEKINHKIWPLIMLTIAGILLLTGDWRMAFHISGDSLALLAALGITFDFIFQKKAIRKTTLEAMAFWRRLAHAFLVGSIWLLTPQLGRASVHDIGWILLMSFGYFALSILMAKAINSQTVADFNLYITLTPALVAILAFFLFKDKLNYYQLFGAGLIITSIFVYNLIRKYDSRHNSGKVRVKIS